MDYYNLKYLFFRITGCGDPINILSLEEQSFPFGTQKRVFKSERKQVLKGEILVRRNENKYSTENLFSIVSPLTILKIAVCFVFMIYVFIKTIDGFKFRSSLII